MGGWLGGMIIGVVEDDDIWMHLLNFHQQLQMRRLQRAAPRVQLLAHVRPYCCLDFEEEEEEE